MPRFSEGIIRHVIQHQKRQLNCVEMHNKNSGSITSRSRQSRSAETEFHIFGNDGRAQVWRRNFKSLAVNAERKGESRTLHLLKTRHNVSAETELQIFGSPSRVDMRKRNF